MKRTILFAVLFLAFIFACSKDNSNPSGSDPNLGTIDGSVLNYKDNTPVANALITTEPPSSSIMSDNSGKFVLDNVTPGTYIIKAEKDGFYANTTTISVSAGKKTTAIIMLTDVISSNHAPKTPDNPSPVDKSQTKPATLSWNCSDEDGDAISYTVYFGESNPPTNKIATDIKTTTTTVSNLKDSVKYYWKVVAKDIYGATTSSPVWSFFTPGKYVNTDNLVALWLFFGNANDASGNNLNGTVNNATLTSDRFGNANSAYFFNGNNSSITIPFSTKLDLGSEFTVAMWIKPSAGYGQMVYDYTYLMSRWDNTGLNTSCFIFGLGPDGKVKAAFYDSQNSIFPSGSATVPIEQWSHIAYVQSNRLLKVYINGNFAYQFNSINPQNSYYDLDIGKSRQNTAFYRGCIDDIYFYHRALTSEEVSKLSNY